MRVGALRFASDAARDRLPAIALSASASRTTGTGAASAARLSLVEVSGPRRDRAIQNIRGQEQSLRLEQPGGSESERVQFQLAAVIRAIEGQQSGLVSDEGDRVACANCAAHDRAGIRVDAAGNVEGEDRNAERVEFLDQRAVSSGKRAREAGAEQAVDGEIEARFSRDFAKKRASRGFPFFQRGQRVLRQLVALAGEDRAHAEEPTLEMCRDLEGVA